MQKTFYSGKYLCETVHKLNVFDNFTKITDFLACECFKLFLKMNNQMIWRANFFSVSVKRVSHNCWLNSRSEFDYNEPRSILSNVFSPSRLSIIACEHTRFTFYFQLFFFRKKNQMNTFSEYEVNDIFLEIDTIFLNTAQFTLIIESPRICTQTKVIVKAVIIVKIRTKQKNKIITSFPLYCYISGRTLEFSKEGKITKNKNVLS